MKAIGRHTTGKVVDQDEQGVAILWPLQLRLTNRVTHHTDWYTWDELERYSIRLEGDPT